MFTIEFMCHKCHATVEYTATEDEVTVRDIVKMLENLNSSECPECGELYEDLWRLHEVTVED